MFDRTYPENPVDTIVKKPFVSFLGSHIIIASGSDAAQLINLKSKQRKSFENVRSTAVLSKKRQYLIEDGNKMVRVYSEEGKLLSTVMGTSQWVTGTDGRCYILRTEREKEEVIRWDGQKLKTLYQSDDKIKKINLLPSERFVMMTEKKHQKPEGLTITLLRTEDSEIFKNASVISDKKDRFLITEIGNTETFLIDFQQNNKPVQEDMVEVWYAGDKTLRDRGKDTKIHDFWLWNLNKGVADKISDKRFSEYIAMLDDRFLWAYHTDEAFSYTGDREFDFFLYDTQNQTAEKVFERTRGLIASVDGRFTLAYTKIGKKWILYDLKYKKKMVMPFGSKYSNPIFTAENTVLFESETDIAKYSLKTGQWELLNWGKGNTVVFHNFIPKTVHELTGVTADIRQWESSEPLFLKISRDQNNDSGYFVYENNRIKEIIPFTANKVKYFTYSNHSRNFFSMEENFKMAGDLFERRIAESEKKNIYRSNPGDKTVLEMKQEIIRFKNSFGRELKGILYYPARFDASKKYPVVVHIYGVLHTHADKFLQLEWGDNGFSKRLLLENGYFVFQPDTVVDERGPGVSALDDVHSGLDALMENINIDSTRMGLIGHSFGGYKANYIAAHSKRFKAFVSGAAVGELVNFYFSFSDLFKIADYARFETGQFAFNVPYADNKELYFKNNPINYVENVTTPLLIWSGKKDANTKTAMTMNWYMALVRNKKKAVALLYQNQKHNFTKNSPEIIDLNNKVMEWWDYFLKEKKDIPWIDREMIGNELNLPLK
ncbi:prolyl oligopeptidase family serine peptidase [Chryseobacterium formosus]|uniref:Prolyl oligopeptidase family serine peptidase n=1 Tax=Chryseobacterium formosus TaxID=1537363 RepID=A0ABT3XW53_9FLAO|nr:prolyl oligopeptidase family serine peptidase [Chryseobacterium formosus]MCX8525898.1 prolyl oligopeptidase family serine peptidase [Chryseobacterium formosus]